MPLDALTAARLARDGEKAGPIRHMCSGQHAVSLLLSKLNGWDPLDYWQPSHPSQVAYRAAVARAYGTTPRSSRPRSMAAASRRTRFPLREVARAYAMLADPSALPAKDPRRSLAREPDDRPRRDARRARDGRRPPRPPRHVAHEGGARAGSSARPGWRRCAGSRSSPGPRAGSTTRAASGLAVKIEDGDGYDRGTWAASVEALRQAGVLDGGALRALARYHRPTILDPHGRVGAEAVAEFELAPVGELIG